MDSLNFELVKSIMQSDLVGNTQNSDSIQNSSAILYLDNIQKQSRSQYFEYFSYTTFHPSIIAMEALRQQKQQYLRINILQRNYDPNEFMDFCQSSIGSVDIDEWTFEQLAKIVDDFVRSKTTASNTTQFEQPNIANEFSNWGTFIQQIPVKKQQTKFQLNLLDLDFLQGMGGSSKTQSPAKSNNPTQNVKSPSVLNKTQTNQNPNFISVPADIAKKLQQGNDNFIVGYNASSIPTQKKNELQSMSPTSVTKQQPREPQVPVYSLSISQTSSQSFSKTLGCKKIVNKSRLQGNEQVIISGHEIVNPNVFVPKYVLYFVTVNPLNIEVRRRFKDFENFRNLLMKFFPTTQIPHLQKSSRLSETEPNNIKRQILFLESFINNLLMKKQLKCKLLQQFLLCPDLDLLKKLFKQYEKLSSPKSLQTLFSTSGQLQLKMSNENRKYLNEHIGLSEYMKEYFVKTKNLYDNLIQGFQQSTKTLTEIQDLQKQFKQKIKNVNILFTPQYQCPQLEKTIQRIQMMHKQWATSFKTQVRIIQTEVRHLYRFEQDNIVSVQQLLKFEQQIASAYNKRSDKDQAHRQPYQSKKLDEFKISIENPSKNITVLKHQAAYMQQKVSQECLGYLYEISRKLDNKYKLFCTLQCSISQDMENVWKGFQSYYN